MLITVTKHNIFLRKLVLKKRQPLNFEIFLLIHKEPQKWPYTISSIKKKYFSQRDGVIYSKKLSLASDQWRNDVKIC